MLFRVVEVVVGTLVTSCWLVLLDSSFARLTTQGSSWTTFADMLGSAGVVVALELTWLCYSTRDFLCTWLLPRENEKIEFKLTFLNVKRYISYVSAKFREVKTE